MAWVAVGLLALASGVAWWLLVGRIAPHPTPVPPSKPVPPVTRVIAVGDVMLSRNVGKLARQQRDPAWPFRRIAPTLAGADLAFANLESPFSDKGRRAESGLIFKAEPDMIDGLKLAGIDIVSTANNHSRDQGTRGLDFTWNWLRQHGIVSVGAGPNEPTVRAGEVLVRNGVRFGFLAYTYDQSNGNLVQHPERVAELRIDRMREDVANLKQRADVVLVSMHAGVEYWTKPHPSQQAFARAAVDAGAAAVIGHHPHVIQPHEVYHGGLILYSLGNFVFDQYQRRETQKGMLAELVFTGPRLTTYALKPVDIRRSVPELTRQ